MDYLKLLEDGHYNTAYLQGTFDLNRLEFLAEEVFNFTTYENEISSMMAEKALEVCIAISESKTYEYIESKEGNLWYLIMVNMPFFDGRLEWGSSIRGAWWNLMGSDIFIIESCGLFLNDEQITKVEFNKTQWVEFIKAMNEFVK